MRSLSLSRQQCQQTFKLSYAYSHSICFVIFSLFDYRSPAATKMQIVIPNFTNPQLWCENVFFSLSNPQEFRFFVQSESNPSSNFLSKSDHMVYSKVVCVYRLYPTAPQRFHSRFLYDHGDTREIIASNPPSLEYTQCS